MAPCRETLPQQQQQQQQYTAVTTTTTPLRCSTTAMLRLSSTNKASEANREPD